MRCESASASNEARFLSPPTVTPSPCSPMEVRSPSAPGRSSRLCGSPTRRRSMPACGRSSASVCPTRTSSTRTSGRNSPMPAIRNWTEVSGMLRELRVSNMAVIVDARLDVGSRFTALTGETGSGKSVCVGALRAALGGRTDLDVLRPAAATGRATAVFDGVTPALRARIAGLGIPDDELLTLSREIVRGGRGSCRINGALVSLSVLREIGEAVAEVTLQGASQRLLRRPWQRDLLDAAGGDAGLAARRNAANAIRSWRDTTSALDVARRATRSGAAEVERARELIADLETLQLSSCEADNLNTERARLRSASRLLTATEA